jgi:Protein of unknown function (DUF3991)/Toprim-like
MREPAPQTARGLTFGQRRQLLPGLRAIALERVLALCGAQPDRQDRHKWHTAVGVLSVNGPKFMNWQRGLGGGGAIDLVIHLQHLDFKTAVDWLVDHFPTVVPAQPHGPRCEPGVHLPIVDPGQWERVQRYLVEQRALPRALLEPLRRAGTLYADARANAVFLLRDRHHVPVGAELRGTTDRVWRGLAPGSQKDRGCFSIPPESRSLLILCESAIDAISCLALHPHVRCLSTAGARPNPRWLQPLLDQGYTLFCGFDADPTGDYMAHAMIARHPTIQRLRPSRHDWNDVLRTRS